MNKKYIIAVLVVIVLFLLYSRRVSGMATCPTGQYFSTTAGICLQGSSTTNVAVKTKTTRKR